MDDLQRELEREVENVPDFPEPGIQFKDITPILARPSLVKRTVEALAAPFLEKGISEVVGIEARGFILGAMLAHELEAGFVPVRKQGNLPRATLVEEYSLEYGTDAVEVHADALGEGDRVLIHDDLIATGGTAAATGRLVKKAGATVVGLSFLIELEALQGRDQLDEDLHVHALLSL